MGRRHEVAEVKQMLSRSRMVTLIGVGGVGKSRLALRVATDLRRAFPDGAYLVEIDSLSASDLVAQTVVEALEIIDHSSRPAEEVLIDHLRGSRTLLVLDNCEHLLQSCAMLAETLLRALPDLRILATSREPFGILSEQTLTVPTLTLSDSGTRQGASLPVPDAVQLFAERAEAVVPGFTITDDNAAAVEQICRRLDGIPLSIELAAVRLRALSPQQLLDRLDDRFRLLTAGARGVLPRHQTLRAMVDWSYDLCSPAERLLWARVSVFNGSLDMEAAEAVCAGDGIAEEEIVDLVTGLVEKSVLIREDYPSGVRYRLLDTIRYYGRERLLESGEESAVKTRYRDHYLRLAALARANLFCPSQMAGFIRLRMEHGNLRTALEYCFAERAGLCLEMAIDLLYHWIIGYYVSEGRGWLERGLAEGGGSGEVRARALWACGWIAIIQGDTASASAMLKEARSIAERQGLRSDLAFITLHSGMLAMCQGDARSALALYEDALARHRAIGDPLGMSLTLIHESLAHSFLGESGDAIACAEESLAICDAYGEGWHRAYTNMALGIELWRQGDTRRATSLEKDSLRFNRSLDGSLGVGVNIEVLAWIAATERRFPRAARLLGVLDTIWQVIGAQLSDFPYLVRYHDECVAETSRALGGAAFRTAVGRGARMPYEDAIAFALEEAAPVAEKHAVSPLTRREAEIARLVARGMSNREIAAALVISQRTAEGHIEHILQKLGFNSRAQIASWVAEQAGVPDEERPTASE